MRKNLTNIIFILFCSLILALSLRGNFGNPAIESSLDERWTEEGPFELSPERSRYALTYSLVEDGSFRFGIPLARFILPDVGFHNNQYVSLFAPGVSFLIIPGYLIGKTLSISQVGTYATIALFALTNAFLIKAVATRMGAHPLAAALSGLIFLFGSPAFAYAVSLYQHHISVLGMLLSLYALLLWHPFWSPALVWFLTASSISVDYPNGLMMLPFAIYTLMRIASVRKVKDKLALDINLKGIMAMLIMLFPIIFFIWTNLRSYGNPFQLAGTVQGVREIDENGYPVEKVIDGDETISITQEARSEKKAIGFFKTRNMFNGLLVHTVSPDRGIIWYTPVVLFGIAGAVWSSRKKPAITSLMLAVIGVNLTLYSMWGDPWGGWAFGSRYLIPSYALLSVFIGLALTQLKKRRLFLIVFFLILSYSLAVNSLGALTTSKLPPKGEAIQLGQTYLREEKYTFLRNWDHLNSKGSKSFLFRLFASRVVSARTYYFLITSLLIVSSGIALVGIARSKDKKKEIYV